MEYDIFISHASEDKDSVVRPLVSILEERGLKVWLDEQKIKLGDSLHQSIDEGLSQSRFGVVVLSPAFFKKQWTKRELDALISRDVSEGKVILPIWHNISLDKIQSMSPLIADKIAISTDEGLIRVADAIETVVLSTSPSSKINLKKTSKNKETNELITSHWFARRRDENVNFRLQQSLFEYKIDPPNSRNFTVDYIRTKHSLFDSQDKIEKRITLLTTSLYSSGYFGYFLNELFCPLILEVAIDIPDLSVNVDDNSRLLTIETYPVEVVPILPTVIFEGDMPGLWFRSCRENYWSIYKVFGKEKSIFDYDKLTVKSIDDRTNTGKDRWAPENIGNFYFVIPKGSKLETSKTENLIITIRLEGENFNPIVQSYSLPTIWFNGRET